MRNKPTHPTNDSGNITAVGVGNYEFGVTELKKLYLEYV